MSLTIVLWVLLIVAIAGIALASYRTHSLATEAVRLVPRAGKMQAVRGGSVHYVDMGPKDAQPLVMIHGLGGQLQHFTYGLAELLTEQFRVIAVDRPGSGYSERDSDTLATFPEQARMIGEALDALGIERPVLVGHSLGGAVALSMALERPERTTALALLCPATQPQTETPEVFKGLQVKSPLMRRLIGHTIAVPLAAATADKVLAAVFYPEHCPKDFMERSGAALGLRPQGFIGASADLMGFHSVVEHEAARYAGELTVPGGILFGAADAVLSPTLHGHTMQAHGLTCETLPGRGHMIPMTAPQDCAAFIRRIAEQVH